MGAPTVRSNDYRLMTGRILIVDGLHYGLGVLTGGGRGVKRLVTTERMRSALARRLQHTIDVLLVFEWKKKNKIITF